MWNMGEAEEADEIIEVYHEGRMTTAEMLHFLPWEGKALSKIFLEKLKKVLTNVPAYAIL